MQFPLQKFKANSHKVHEKRVGSDWSNFTIHSTFQISSTETETEDEDMMPDLDGRRSAAAAMAAHAHEEAALATSSDSLASLIPPEKKQSIQGRLSVEFENFALRLIESDPCTDV